MNKVRKYIIKITCFSKNCRRFIFSNAMLGFGISSIEVFLGLYFLALGFREDFIGTYYAVSTGTSALLLLLMGRLSDKIGRVASFYLTIAGHLTGYSLLFFFQSRTAIFFCAFLNGASTALRACTSAPFLHENSKPAERDYVFSASASYLLIGSMFGNVFGGYLPIALLNISPSFAAGAGAAYRYSILISMFLILFSIFPLYGIPARTQDGFSGIKSPFGAADLNHAPAKERRSYTKFIIYTFFIGCGAGLIIPFFNVYFARKFGMNSGQIGVIFMCANVLTAVSMLLTPLLSAKYGKIHAIVFMEIASLPFLLILGFSSSLELCIMSYLARNVLMNMNNPVFTGYLMDRTSERDRGRVNSAVTLGDNFSRTLSTYVSGRLMSDHGVSLPYVLTAMFYAFAAIYAYISFARFDKPPKKAIAE